MLIFVTSSKAHRDGCNPDINIEMADKERQSTPTENFKMLMISILEQMVEVIIKPLIQESGTMIISFRFNWS